MFQTVDSLRYLTVNCAIGGVVTLSNCCLMFSMLLVNLMYTVRVWLGWAGKSMVWFVLISKNVKCEMKF